MHVEGELRREVTNWRVVTRSPVSFRMKAPICVLKPPVGRRSRSSPGKYQDEGSFQARDLIDVASSFATAGSIHWIAANPLTEPQEP